MDGLYQATIVAAYRIRNQIEAVLAEDREMRWQRQQAQAQAERLSRRGY